MFDENGDLLYRQIKRSLVEEILSGRYGDDVQVPSETALARSFDVSAPTARHALRELVDEKVLIARRGAGYFVSASGRKRLKADARAYFLESRVASFVWEARSCGLILSDVQKKTAEEWEKAEKTARDT